MNAKRMRICVALACFVLAASGAWAAAPQAEHGAAGHGAGQTGGQPGAQMGGMMGKGMMGGHMGGQMGGRMAGLPPEKQEQVRKIVDEFKPKLFNLRQDLYTRRMELEAVLSQAQPDMSKAKALAKEIGTIYGQMYETGAEMRVRVVKETGYRMPYGLGLWGGGRAGMGGGGCPMMSGGHGGMGGGGMGGSDPMGGDFPGGILPGNEP